MRTTKFVCDGVDDLTAAHITLKTIYLRPAKSRDVHFAFPASSKTDMSSLLGRG